MQGTLPLEDTARTLTIKGRQRSRRRKLRETLSAYGFLAPYLIILGAFTLIATAYAFYLSFFYVDFGFGEPIFYGTKNYQNIWYDLTHGGDFAISLKNIIFFTVGVVIVQTVLALALALLVNQKLRGMSIFRTAIFLPTLTSSVAIALIFLWLYNTHGAINDLLSLVGIHGPNWLNETSTALPSIMALNIWTTAPTFMLLYLAGLQDIPEQLYEAARVDGAGRWRTIWSITVPLLRPTTFAVMALGTIGCFQMFDQSYIMEGTNGDPLKSTLTPVLVIYNTAFGSSLMGRACAEAVILFVVIFAFTIIQRRFIDVNIQY
ncbi:MAG TPA: sugar ABC transporter permease [Ktedonobacterales bacterium]|nr:sugar ABC transporter permease [Ktedonobacterales bacterium]